eukprot:symbB.v1.2.029172.t2/scaffold3165.1/size62113/1
MPHLSSALAPLGEAPRVVLVGIPLHRLSRHHQLPCLAILVLVSSILAAALQERVLYVPGFRYTGWLAFLTSLTYMLLAMVERFVEKDTLRRGSLVEYVKLSFLTMGGMYFTNFSLHYLSYSLRVVFKSSKLVPVMLLGVVYLKKHYTPSQYLAVGLLTAGVVVFTLGDAKGRAFFNPMGIAFIVAGSLSDAMAANYEEKDSRVVDLKQSAQRLLGGFVRLVTGGDASRILHENMETLQQAGLRNGDVLTAITLQSRISSTERAFALWCPGGSRIVTWGDPSYGGDAVDISETFRDVQDVQGSHRAFAILLGDGEVVTRGDRGYGGDSLPVQHLLQNVKRLFSTLRAFSALKTDGSIVTWGPGGWGGDSTKVQLQLGDVQHVYSTDSAFAAHLQNGSVVTWGGSCWGGDSQKVQEELQEVEDVTATCGAFAAKLANGKVVTWGHPDFGADSSAVEEMLRDVKVVKATLRAFCALLSNGTVVTWGSPAYGGRLPSVLEHGGVSAGAPPVTKIYATKGGAFAALREDGQLVTWGLEEYGGESGILELKNVEEVYATAGAFCALVDGSLVTWGHPRYGGDGNVASNLRNVRLVHATSRAFAAVMADGQVTERMGCSASEVVLYSSALGSVWALLAEAVTGELLPAWTHSRDHLEAVPLMLVASVFGYIAQSGVLLLIKHFGATAAEIVKSCRKVTTILISFMVYGKAWNGYHVAGTLLFVNSVAVERFHSGKSSKRFATFLFSLAALVALGLLLGGIGPSTFSVVIDAGSAGTRVNVFRFDAWTLKLLDMNGAAQIFVEEEPGIGDLNSSCLVRLRVYTLEDGFGWFTYSHHP